MEVEPTTPFENFEDFLTEISKDSDIWLNVEKLFEVIQLELKFRVHPKITKENIHLFQWTDGYTNIFISIHVEDVDQTLHQYLNIDIGKFVD